MHIQVEHLLIKKLFIWHAYQCRQKDECHSEVHSGNEMKLIQFTYHELTATYFSCGEPPPAGLSWLGFCGSWGFCCTGGLPPGPPWPWAAGLGCWVVGAPGRLCWPGAFCCCDPAWDCCLGIWAGLCGCGCPPDAFWAPAEGFCWDTDCCLWAWGELPWLRWGAPCPTGRGWAEGPWLALAWELGSPEPGLTADCWVWAGGWPWGWGRCWDGGLCCGPPRRHQLI